MEATLTHNLICLAIAYSAASGASLSTLGEKAGGDWRFFDRLRVRGVNFRVRTYDRAVAWFAAHWPEGLEWPVDVPRPVAPEAGPAGSAPGSTPTREPAEISEDRA